MTPPLRVETVTITLTGTNDRARYLRHHDANELRQ